MRDERWITALIEDDHWMMDILRTVQLLNLPDCWVCAGFVRAKVWDALHGYETRTPLPDIDVVYFDSACLEEQAEKQLEARLAELQPGQPWSVKNEARMHLVGGLPPYTSTEDAVSNFPETATALAVRLNAEGRVVLSAPWGVQDLLDLSVRPTPLVRWSEERLRVFAERVAKKNWKAVWPRITVEIPLSADRIRAED
ncbi:nucleotidyltransferase family protein [Paenibacillus aurantiacus]|uniref:Nucleotidyltransferase family protein n=1 Tax=Paenibacillus aurantiacus TaxID=1936118 RepID=A0ABV5KVE5_9BACL